ncbi:MAG: MFS transporter [Oscillospiraceae bacterium]
MKQAIKRMGWKTKRIERLSYYLGSGAENAVSTFVGVYLSAYLLMSGIDVTISAIVLLVVKIWDAINDMLFGYIVDKVRFHPGKSRLSQWFCQGRFLPWFKVGIFILPISMIVLFSINITLPIWGRVIWFMLGYMLYDFAFTICDVPYCSMLTTLTDSHEERIAISSYRPFGQGIGALPVSFLGAIFIVGGTGYTRAAVIFAIVSVLCAIPMLFLVKEHNYKSPTAGEKRYSIREMLSFVFHEKSLVSLFSGKMFFSLLYTASYTLFIAYYIFNNAMISVLYMAIGVIPTLLMLPFFPILYRHVEKMTVIKFACGINSALCLIIFFVGYGNPPLHFVLYSLMTLSYTCILLTFPMVTPDVAELCRYKTGTESTGMIYAMDSVITKFVGSFSGTISLLVLGLFGYQAVTAGSFEELAVLNQQGIGLQTDLALTGLWFVSFLLPAIGFGLAFVAFHFYKLREKDVRIMIKINTDALSREEGEKLLSKKY